MPDWFFWWIFLPYIVLMTGTAIGGLLSGDTEDGRQLRSVALQLFITGAAAGFVALVTIYGGSVLGLFSKFLVEIITAIL